MPHLDSFLADDAVALANAAPGVAPRQLVEAVIMPGSTPVGSRVDTLDLLHSQSISEVAVATQTPRIEGSLADLQRSIGDVLYLSGDQEAIDEAVAMAERTRDGLW